VSQWLGNVGVPPLGGSAPVAKQTRPPKGGTPTLYILSLALASVLPASLRAISPDELATIQTELREPITLKLSNRNTVIGNPVNVSNDSIQMASAEGAGEIVFTFRAEEIRQIDVPGESYKTLALEWMRSGQTEDALELMALLYKQRGPLLPLMPASESHFFVYYADLVLDSPKPARAIAITENLRPQIENPEALRMLDDALLESYQTLELYEQAAPLAEKWLEERNPYGESALGYYVLAASKLRSEAYDEALEFSLQPIVFSSPIPTDKLAHCYAVAVSAALGLRERAYATTLYREMKERGLAWPADDRTLEPYFNKLKEYIEQHEPS